jgi:hypothetical protein
MSNQVFKRFDVDLNNLSVPKKWQGTPLTDLYVDLYYNTIWHIEDLRKFFKNVPLDSTPETITLKPQPLKNKIPKRTAIWLAVSVVAYLLDPPNLYLVFIAWVLEPFWMKLFQKNKEGE